MKLYKRNISLILILITLISCGGRQTTSEKLQEENLMTIDQDSVSELPFPVIPDSITDPLDRADYALLHFWDEMDFSDRNLTADEPFLEQNFVNYYSLFNYGSEEGKQNSVRNLIEKAAVDSLGLHKFLKVSDRYLFDPNSPMRNDRDYIIFLKTELISGVLPDYELEWRDELLKLASKNNAGQKAENFSFHLQDGSLSFLYKLKFTGNLIVYFYDPDCDNCERIKEELKAAKILSRQIAQGEITFLAVAATEDYSQWQKAVSTMPQSWIHAIDYGQTDDKMLYDLRALPTLYLLDPSLKVIAKDFDPSAIE